MDIEFNSIEDLYKRVEPALNSKVKEFKRQGISFIKKEDIWNYLIDSKWKNSKGLELFNIVDDILNTNNEDISKYVTNKLKDMERRVNLDNINFR